MKILNKILFMGLLYCGIMQAVSDDYSSYDYRFEGGIRMNPRKSIRITPENICNLPTQKAKNVEFLRLLRKALYLSGDYGQTLENDIKENKCIENCFQEIKDEVALFFKKLTETDSDNRSEVKKVFTFICEKLDIEESELNYLK